MTCIISNNVAGPCAACGFPLDGAHLVDREAGETKVERLAIYCANCCPMHRQAEIEWGEPVKTITGQQEGLF